MNAVETVIRGVLATLPATGVIATTLGGAASAMYLGAAQPTASEPRLGAIGTAEKRVTSVQLLPADLRDEIAPSLQRAGGRRLAVTAQPSAVLSDADLGLACGQDWFITWDEDAGGNPVARSFVLHCGAADSRIGSPGSMRRAVLSPDSADKLRQSATAPGPAA
jgi:hypothetical protein